MSATVTDLHPKLDEKRYGFAARMKRVSQEMRMLAANVGYDITTDGFYDATTLEPIRQQEFLRRLAALDQPA